MRRGLTFDDVLLVPKYNDIPSRRDVDTSVQMGGYTLQIPVISSNMDTITGPQMCAKMSYLGGMGILHRFCSIEDNVKMARTRGSGYGASLGLSEGMERANALYEAGTRIFCLDIAHGHSKSVKIFMEQLRQEHPGVYVIAGNVATYEGAQYLVDCGADAVKVGIGPGSVCSTRVKTGFGVPQLTAIQDCSRSDAFIIADGGIRSPGDAVKALAAGADAIMLGGMLAGTDETPGEIQQDTEFRKPDNPHGYAMSYSERNIPIGPEYKVFRGMASKDAQDDHFGRMSDWKAAEGVSVKVLCKGPVEDVINDLMGGIRSGLTYCGAKNIRQLKHKSEFIEITNNGYREGTPHYET